MSPHLTGPSSPTARFMSRPACSNLSFIVILKMHCRFGFMLLLLLIAVVAFFATLQLQKYRMAVDPTKAANHNAGHLFFQFENSMPLLDDGDSTVDNDDHKDTILRTTLTNPQLRASSTISDDDSLKSEPRFEDDYDNLVNAAAEAAGTVTPRDGNHPQCSGLFLKKSCHSLLEDCGISYRACQKSSPCGRQPGCNCVVVPHDDKSQSIVYCSDKPVLRTLISEEGPAKNTYRRVLQIRSESQEPVSAVTTFPTSPSEVGYYELVDNPINSLPPVARPTPFPTSSPTQVPSRSPTQQPSTNSPTMTPTSWPTMPAPATYDRGAAGIVPSMLLVEDPMNALPPVARPTSFPTSSNPTSFPTSSNPTSVPSGSPPLSQQPPNPSAISLSYTLPEVLRPGRGTPIWNTTTPSANMNEANVTTTNSSIHNSTGDKNKTSTMSYNSTSSFVYHHSNNNVTNATNSSTSSSSSTITTFTLEDATMNDDDDQLLITPFKRSGAAASSLQNQPLDPKDPIKSTGEAASSSSGRRITLEAHTTLGYWRILVIPMWISYWFLVR